MLISIGYSGALHTLPPAGIAGVHAAAVLSAPHLYACHFVSGTKRGS